MQSVYSTGPVNKVTEHLLGGVLLLCRGAIGVFNSPIRQDKAIYVFIGSKYVAPIYPTPPLGQDRTQGQFLSGV